MLSIAYDREKSTELEPKYYVHDSNHNVVYSGSYPQCLVVVGAVRLAKDKGETITLAEIDNKCNGYLQTCSLRLKIKLEINGKTYEINSERELIELMKYFRRSKSGE